LNHDFKINKEEWSIEILSKYVENFEFSHIVYGSGFENHPEIVEKLENKCDVLGNSSEKLRRVRDWKYFFGRLEELDIPSPKTIFPSNYVLKPYKTGGGQRIYKTQFFLQEFIPGKPISASLISNGTKVACICLTQQITGTPANPFRYVGNIVPFECEKHLLVMIKEICEKIVKDFGLIGSIGVDMILKDVPYVIEVNPRIQGSMEVIEKAYELNIFDMHVKSCLGDFNFSPKPKKEFWGKKIVFAEKETKYMQIEKHDFVKDIPHFGEKFRAGEPICTVLANGKNEKEVKAKLSQRENIIRRGLSE
jgi:hypothetical protein